MRCATTSSACWWLMTSKAIALMFSFTAAACLGGCADFSHGNGPQVADAAPDLGAGATNADGAAAKDDATSSAPVTFADVHPLLMMACRECHRAGGQAANTSLLYNGTISIDLAATLPYVNRNDAVNSRLLTKAAGRDHGGGTVWAATAPPAVIVLKWIQHGTQP